MNILNHVLNIISQNQTTNYIEMIEINGIWVAKNSQNNQNKIKHSS